MKSQHTVDINLFNARVLEFELGERQFLMQLVACERVDDLRRCNA